MKSWPQGGPALAWKTQGLGAGFSSLSIVGDRIYTMGDRGDSQYVLALDDIARIALRQLRTCGGLPCIGVPCHGRHRRGDWSDAMFLRLHESGSEDCDHCTGCDGESFFLGHTLHLHHFFSGSQADRYSRAA